MSFKNTSIVSIVILLIIQSLIIGYTFCHISLREDIVQLEIQIEREIVRNEVLADLVGP